MYSSVKSTTVNSTPKLSFIQMLNMKPTPNNAQFLISLCFNVPISLCSTNSADTKQSTGEVITQMFKTKHSNYILQREKN